MLYSNLAPRLECAPLWTEENILEVQLDVVLNARHYGEWFNELKIKSKLKHFVQQREPVQQQKR